MGLEGVQAPSFDPEPPTGTRKDWWCLSRLEEGHYKVSAVRQEAPRKVDYLGNWEQQSLNMGWKILQAGLSLRI